MTLDEKNKAKAVLVIKKYINRNYDDEYILSNFALAVDQLIENATKLQAIKTAGVKSISEGNQSITFEADAWTITPDVKALLPKPYLVRW